VVRCLYPHRNPFKGIQGGISAINFKAGKSKCIVEAP